MKKHEEIHGRRYVVRGRVQGVGYRWFVEKVAYDLTLRGYVRNQPDGSVEVVCVGGKESLRKLEDQLWQGPRGSVVASVQSEEAAVVNYEGFQIRF